MTLIDELKEDLDEAVRERDEDLRDAIRLILNSLQLAEKELQRPLTQDEELQVLQRERKRRVEAAEAFRAAGREEQAEDEEYELEVLEDYMPDPLSDDEPRGHRRRRDRRGRRHEHARLRPGDGGRDAAGVRPRGRVGREPDRPREARLAGERAVQPPTWGHAAPFRNRRMRRRTGLCRIRAETVTCRLAKAGVETEPSNRARFTGSTGGRIPSRSRSTGRRCARSAIARSTPSSTG